MRGDVRAVQKFTNDVVKKELSSLSKNKIKRVSVDLTKRRQYVANMRQDELKLAVLTAQEPQRPRRDLLYAMYHEVWTNDGHMIGESRKAILKAIGSPFGVFKIGSEEIDQEATRLLQKKWFEDYRRYFHEADFWGHSLVQFIEVIPTTAKGMKYEFKKVELIEREHVRPEEGFIVLDISHEKGIPFRDDAIKKKLCLIEMGSPRNLGLLRVACKEFIWKNYSRGDWSRHSEKFGMPWLALKAATTDKTELDKLEKMASEFGNNLWMILDPDDEVEMKEAMDKDSYKIYEELAKFANTEISKAISGATGTSDEKAFVGGAEVHERILNEFVEASKRAETYHNNEELFPFLIEHGYPFQDREFRYLDYQQADPEATQGESNNKSKGQGGDPEKKPEQKARYKMNSM